MIKGLSPAAVIKMYSKAVYNMISEQNKKRFMLGMEDTKPYGLVSFWFFGTGVVFSI